MPAFMKLSPETIQELTEMTRGISLPHSGLLYVFFIHLLPGLKSKEIRKLISLAQPDTANNDFAAIIFTLNTIEERVMALHAEKRELFDQVINDTGKASPLSITDLRELM